MSNCYVLLATLFLPSPNISITNDLKDLLVSKIGRIPHRNMAEKTQIKEITTHAVKKGLEKT